MSEIVGLLSPSAESQHDDESQHDEKEEYQLRTQSYSKHKSRMVSYLLLGMGIASLITNIIQFRLGIQARQAADACKLPLSRVEPTVEVDFGDKTPYGDIEDLDELDRLWYSLDTNPGIIALPYDRHLGTTFTFPWDLSKGIYVMNSYHSLHCLQGIYAFARAADSGANQTQTLEHVVHCLDVLRSEVMCTADDTPLSFRFQELHQTERAPKRKCRDWNKFQEFLTENSACYRRGKPGSVEYDTLREFMNCPPGSPYNAVVDKLLQEDGK